MKYLTSIHSTQTGRDQPTWEQAKRDMQLQSTLPKRVETRINKKGRLPVKLQSTLPKRVETYFLNTAEFFTRYFNPLYPNG